MKTAMAKYQVKDVVLTGEQLEGLADLLAPPTPASHTLTVIQTVTDSGGRHTYCRVHTSGGRCTGMYHVGAKTGQPLMVSQD